MTPEVPVSDESQNNEQQQHGVFRFDHAQPARRLAMTWGKSMMRITTVTEHQNKATVSGLRFLH
jgi:hypothetical protein